MSWQSVSDMVLRLQEHINEVPTNLDTRAQGGILAEETFGMQTVLDQPELVTFGVLTIMQRRATVYAMSAGATNLVHSTDLHTLPGQPPRLLRTAWIVESRIPEREPLFGDTASLAGYPLDGNIYLIGLRYPMYHVGHLPGEKKTWMPA